MLPHGQVIDDLLPSVNAYRWNLFVTGRWTRGDVFLGIAPAVDY